MDCCQWISTVHRLAHLKLDNVNLVSKVITSIDNYSDCRLADLYLSIFAAFSYLAPYVILYSPDPTLLLWTVYCNIEYFTIANKTTDQDDELMYLDQYRSENLIHHASCFIMHGKKKSNYIIQYYFEC